MGHSERCPFVGPGALLRTALPGLMWKWRRWKVLPLLTLLASTPCVGASLRQNKLNWRLLSILMKQWLRSSLAASCLRPTGYILLWWSRRFMCTSTFAFKFLRQTYIQTFRTYIPTRYIKYQGTISSNLMWYMIMFVSYCALPVIQIQNLNWYVIWYV